MKIISVIMFFSLCILACKNNGKQDDSSISNGDPTTTEVQDTHKTKLHDYLHSQEKKFGKFGCIPRSSIDFDRDKFYITTLDRENRYKNKNYIFFDSAYMHILNKIDSIVGYETINKVYMEINSVILLQWNLAIPGRDERIMQVGICSNLVKDTILGEVVYIFERGAIVEGTYQFEPKQCNCYSDCEHYNNGYWND